MGLRVYLDTSVSSAYFDEATPDRRIQTAEFWACRGQFEIATSELAREELEQTPDLTRRKNLLKLLEGIVLHPITPEVRELALHYISSDAFTALMYNDAVHVAAAVLNRQDALLSWNFKHLVNRRRHAQIIAVDTRLGLPLLEIVAPPEI